MRGLTIPSGPLEVLCLGAHPDDIEIGCGATLLGLAERPSTRFTALVLTGGGERELESRAALEQFAPGIETHFAHLPDGRLPAHWQGAKDALESLARACRPGLVLAPRTDDAHQDHRLVGTLAGTVWRDALILHYEIPKWDGDLASPRSTRAPPTSGRAARSSCSTSTSPASWTATGGTTRCSSA
ncbi:PIG-L deacetylase family protein [Nocardioides sp. TF02-7]|uniref:PIG-L deacetylase family protein n=1 Tax=Nocardioides sp. TF02-7 TaxID=2917724 RepID=UPI001F057602|nr:PIG-L deacetylase family protein [Nocardioides sp. TF02-7]UMG91532.1 PIG-L family deacetylase [Nocardioides sp. TF02-7]